MTKVDTRDLIITRLFDAPRELVWKAWTEPERISPGGGLKVLHHQFSRSICEWVASYSAACDHPMARTIGAKASTVKS